MDSKFEKLSDNKHMFAQVVRGACIKEKDGKVKGGEREIKEQVREG